MKRWLPALALAVAALPSNASADDASADDAPPIAVLAVEIAGDAAPELRPRVAEAIAAGLGEAGREVVTLSTVMASLAEAPELLGCTSVACLERLADRVDAREFVRARLRADGVTYSLEFELLSAESDDDAGGLEADCTVCTMTELFEFVRATASELLHPKRTATASVVIHTKPPGAVVEIGGRTLGRAPAEAKLPVGQHEISAQLDHHHQATTSIRVRQGEPGPHVINLVLVPESAPVSGKSSRYSPWKWIAAGGAVASVITSGVLFATHGNPTCTPEPPQTRCPRERDGITPGLVGLGVGAALGGVSGWMFYRDASSGREARVSARGAGATVTLTF